MKIGLYGVSRSGKDFLIKKLINYLSEKNINLYHIRGSETLNKLSFERFDCKFKELSEIKQDLIRKEFIEYAGNLEKKYDNIIIDGHYSFYKKNMSIKRVFTDNDLKFYDLFFYLDTNPIDILKRMQESFGEKRNDVFNEEDIINWKNYEVDHMTDELIDIEKELHIIKYENNDDIDYIYKTIIGVYNSKLIAYELVLKLDLTQFNSVILVDCDKTLSLEDTTSLILKKRNLDTALIKNIYKYDRYSNYQALASKKYYQNINLFDGNYDFVNEELHLNNNLIEDLKSKTSSLIVGITGGNSELWKKILKQTGLKIDVLDADMIMSKYIKYFVLKKIQDLGKYVIAIGDSMLDSLMLKYANKSYIIGNKGKRENIEKFLRQNKHIHQLSYSKYLYDDLITDLNVGSIKCLPTDSIEINSNIMICKSESGIEGKKLRDAHNKLGQEIAKLIETDYPNDSFAVVIMMRSGLCFGQGIADYFDCPIIFYEEENTLKFDEQFFSNAKYTTKKIILVDGVINSGNSMKQLVKKMKDYKTIIATNVISSKFSIDYIHPIYATRISSNSFTGAKQRIILGGKGPDTSDRLFKNMEGD